MGDRDAGSCSGACAGSGLILGDNYMIIRLSCIVLLSITLIVFWILGPSVSPPDNSSPLSIQVGLSQALAQSSSMRGWIVFASTHHGGEDYEIYVVKADDPDDITRLTR